MLYRLAFGIIVLLLVGMIILVMTSPTFDLVKYPGERVVTGVGDLRK